MTSKIFINYRRDDSKGEAQALRTYLEPKLPGCELFMDVDGGISPGSNFVRALDERIASADILLCLIGSRWIDIADERGARRLEGADDFVRVELASALKRDITVIPVLIDDTRMPSEAELPESIRMLAYKQGVRLRHERFNSDADGIAKAIKQRLGGNFGRRPSLWLQAVGVMAALGIGTTISPIAGRLAGADGFFVASGETERLRTRLVNLEDEKAKLESARDAVLATLAARISEVKDREAKLKSANSALDQEKAASKQLSSDLEAARSRTGELELRYAELMKSSRLLEEEKKSARALKQSDKAKIDRLENAKKTATSALSQSQEEVARLQKEVATVKDQIRGRGEENKLLRIEIEQLKKTLAASKRTAEVTTGSIPATTQATKGQSSRAK